MHRRDRKSDISMTRYAGYLHFSTLTPHTEQLGQLIKDHPGHAIVMSEIQNEWVMV